jgi:hypothetical protein
MNRLHATVVGLALVSGLLFAGTSVAYEGIDVKNGGTITGKVTLEGSIPVPRVFPLVLYPFGPFCKKISDGQGNVRLMEFAVGKEGGLKDAIVAVEHVQKGKPFPPLKADFVTIDCMFHPADVPDSEQYAVKADGKLHHEHPLVTVVQNHQPVSIVNRDPVFHNAQFFQNEKGNIILNFPLPVSTEPRGGKLHFQNGKRVTQLICGMHEFMQSWGFVVDNPYYAKTKRDGEFVIDRLPPGTYKVSAWHPHLKIVEKEITVPANGKVVLDFEFSSNEVQRPIYESQKDFRIGPATPHSHMLKEGEERILMEEPAPQESSEK